LKSSTKPTDSSPNWRMVISMTSYHHCPPKNPQKTQKQRFLGVFHVD
jgi:hypothetical protein